MWLKFLHVAQVNQSSYAKHLSSKTVLCAVFLRALFDKPTKENELA